MYRRIHFLSVKLRIIFQVISEPLSLTLRATRIAGQFEQIPNNWRAGFAESQLQPLHPLFADKRGGPGRVHLPSSGHFKGKPPRTKRFNRQDRWAGQEPTTKLSQSTPVFISHVQESPVAKKLTAKVGHMVTRQSTPIQKTTRETGQSQDTQELEESRPYLFNRGYRLKVFS